YRRRELAAFHVWIEVGAARDQHGLLALPGQHRRRLLNRYRGEITERRKPQHQRTPFSSGCHLINLVGQGDGASLGITWGRGTERAGVTSARSALSSLSAVMGVSSIRTPTASKTALAMAGMTGLSGPCPASLPPKGPSRSGISTSMVSISGVSSVVGSL